MQLMSIDDLAAYLGDSKRTIYKYISSGDCPSYIRISAKNIKFDRADVDAWLESKKVLPGIGQRKRGTIPWMPNANEVMKKAKVFAEAEQLSIINSEHILFSILAIEDCLGARILSHFDVDLKKCQAQREQLTGHDDPVKQNSPGEVEEGKQVIQCAHDESKRLGHEYLGTEHLLLGILLTESGKGLQLLMNMGVTLGKVREEMARLIVCPGL
jgi:excisionase family DNA binding protein